MRQALILSVRSGFLAAGLLCSQAAAQQEIAFSGGGSVTFGRIQKSSDTSSADYTGNFIRSMGAQFVMRAKFNDNLNVNVGLGAAERHFLAGPISNSGGRQPYVFAPYLVEGSATYAFYDGDSKLKVTGGYFPYSYNPDVKNLGLYLTRGPVYPGFLISGFETKHTGPVANTLGFRIQHVSGPFEQNLILNSDTENYPFFDISPVYIASVRMGAFLKIGAGVNFYHLIPMDKRLTSPDTALDQRDISPPSNDPYARALTYVDTVAHDTTFLGFGGTKVMANASLDFKALFGGEAFGPEDLRLYAEVAVIGLNQSKPYKDLYGPLSRRMPVMVGFNFPCFRLLDHLAFEVEWYGAKFRDDLARYQSSLSQISPLPVENEDGFDLGRDDWKWSVHASRKIGNVRLAFQAANDHTRPMGTYTSPSNEWQTLFIAPTDWYWMTKIAYSF